MNADKSDLGLVQILPMVDEETGAEPSVKSASIVDPYLMLIRDDNSVFVAQIDKNHELEEVDKTESITSCKWVAGCLYNDTSGIFQPMLGDKGTVAEGKIMMFLLNSLGALHVRHPMPSSSLRYDC